MKLKQAVQILKDHNEWRRYNGDVSSGPQMASPKKLGVAIDVVVQHFENK